VRIAAFSAPATRVVAGCIALLIVIAIHRSAMDHPSALIESLGHALHGPGFAGLALVFFMLTGATRNPRSRYYMAAALSFAAALIAEAAQIPGPRDAQVVDLLIDFAGIVGMLALLAAVSKQSGTRWPRSLFLALGVGLLVFVSAQAIALSHAIVRQYLSQPQIISFDASWERRLIAAQDQPLATLLDAPDNWPDPSGKIYRAEEQARWGIFLKLDPFPDWSDYAALSFIAATADGEPMELAINIWDRADASQLGRENASVTVSPNARRYRVAFESLQSVDGYTPLDRSRIESLVFSAASPGGKRTLLLDDIRLER
tara:strand:+ start:7706 stop:8653 length:948 start_codon:yes stop_codon:yes gene_type:complete